MKTAATFRVDQGLLRQIRAKAKAARRTLSAQVEYYALLGLLAEENPDLPLTFLRGILEGREEIKAGLGRPYEWGVLK